MNVEQIRKSLFWRSLMIGVVADIVLAVAIVYSFARDEEQWWIAIAFIVVAIWVVSAALNLKNLLARMVFFKYAGLEHFEALVLKQLEQSALPQAEPYYRKGAAYLEDLADDQDADATHRVAATAILCDVRASYQCFGTFSAIPIEMAFDNAVGRYLDRLPTQPLSQ